MTLNKIHRTSSSIFSRRPRILAVSHAVPSQDTNAGDRRLLALLGILARDHEVDFLPLNRTDPSSATTRYITGLEELGVSLLPDWGGFSAALAHALYDVVFFEHYNTAENRIDKVRKVRPNAKIVVDTVDVHFARERAAEILGRRDGIVGQTAEDTRRRELAIYRDADLVVAVSSEDDRLLELEGGIRRRLVIPIIAPIRPRLRIRRGPDVLFVGGGLHPPNVDGIIWFVNHIWDNILDHRPDATLSIIGSSLPDEVRALSRRPGVQMVGFVPDIGPYLDRASVSIAPLRYGAGMKGKVAEALASGVPVVTTCFGAQGFGGIDGVHLLIAERESAFADAVVKLLNDQPWAEVIGKTGQHLVAAMCSEDVVASRLLENLDGMLGNRKALRLPNCRWLLHTFRIHVIKALRCFALITGLIFVYRLLRPRICAVH